MLKDSLKKSAPKAPILAKIEGQGQGQGGYLRPPLLEKLLAGGPGVAISDHHF